MASGIPGPMCFNDGRRYRLPAHRLIDLFQIGASVMHKPSGLGIYGLYQTESSATTNLRTTQNTGPNLRFSSS